jgi:hypothetical protein
LTTRGTSGSLTRGTSGSLSLKGPLRHYPAEYAPVIFQASGSRRANSG